MVRWFALGGLLLLFAPGLAFAQDEFVLPEFGVDAGAPEPPPPSPPPLFTAPAPSPSPAPVTPLAPPRWPTIALSAVGVLAGWRNFYAGFEGSAGTVLGTPTLTKAREVAGWSFVPSLDAAWSRLSGPVCAGSDFCGDRWGGGATLKIGHAVGTARDDGEVRVGRFVFGGLSVHGMLVNVPPAPLTQGSRWGELVIRARVGVQLSLASGASRQARTLAVQLSGFGEGLFFNAVGDRFQLGVALGVVL